MEEKLSSRARTSAFTVEFVPLCQPTDFIVSNLDCTRTMNISYNALWND